MSLAQTGLAIGSVSRFLAGVLGNGLASAPPPNPTITIQRPQPAPATGTAGLPRVNLFLYEVELDAAMRNIALTPGTLPPLWVVLRYLLTAFDDQGDSDTAVSHDLLGLSIQVLMGISETQPAPAGYPGLVDNPEPLKLTFDQATPELLSRLMQGPDDKFRCSAAFQVRPVLIAEPLPPTGLQLIGINYLVGTTIGLAGVKNFVLPNLGPQLNDTKPAAVQIGDTLTLLGNNLGAAVLTVNFANASLIPVMQQPQSLEVVIKGLDPSTTAAGNLAVSVTETLPNGFEVTSGIVGVALLPTVTNMTIVAQASVSVTNHNVHATIGIAGHLLGRTGDYVEFALVRNGVAALLIDTPDPTFAPPPDQSQQQFAIPPANAVPPGLYFAVFRVNGQQSKQAFALNLVGP